MGRSRILIGAVVLAALGTWLAFAWLSGETPRAATVTANVAVEVGDETRMSADLVGDIEDAGGRPAKAADETDDAQPAGVAERADAPRAVNQRGYVDQVWPPQYLAAKRMPKD